MERMPYYMDEETKRFIFQVEQHSAVLDDLVRECGAVHYDIGMIREKVGSYRNILEVWILPVFPDERSILEFDRFVPMYDYDLLFRVVNWPDYWDAVH